MEWHLLPARWAEVDAVLLAVADALASGDNRSLLARMSTLELLSPARQGSQAATLPAPAEVRSHLLAAIRDRAAKGA
jgi:CATRA-associated small protein